MSITIEEVQHIAKLSRLALDQSEQQQSLTELNNLLQIFDELQAVDTEGVEPLAQPLSIINEVHLRLRQDEVTEESSEARRDALMKNAPAADQGLFLVPKVVE